MTPQDRARKVVEDVRDHKMFNVDTDGTWERYIASAIKCALEDALPDANELDEVVHELGIEDSDTTPAEAVRVLKSDVRRWSEACRRAGICMSCATAELMEPCHDCLGTGFDGGAPAGYVRELPREPGTCRCGSAPINSDGRCATCGDDKLGSAAEQSGASASQWRAFYAVAWPHLWG